MASLKRSNAFMAVRRASEASSVAAYRAKRSINPASTVCTCQHESGAALAVSAVQLAALRDVV